MRDFGKIPPEHFYTVIVLCVVVWMMGRSLVRPFISPFAADVMGATGVAMTMCAIAIDRVVRKS